ncbi:DMT family transporter [Thermomicrobiaceae bacterium CFH 74404]|uniref:DMT family transporter n=1 Tax=Thermalbibacter longus TaxID=2951981 RepID=A0AA42BBY4_9BACT|nr:DMT family transporter [Thermalbibacter longus]MCM8750329.1 DMT family transporter [Thermalbibacter longus]
MRTPAMIARSAKGARKAALWRWVNLPALAAVVIWGAAFPIVKYALAEFPVLAYAALRPVVAVALLFGLLRLRGESLAVERGDWPRLLLAGYGGMALFQLCYVLGLDNTSASHSALLLCASPLLGAVILWVAGRERPEIRSLAGLLLGLAGVALVVLQADPSGSASLMGDLLTLLAALGWVVVTALPRPLVVRYGPVKVTAWLLLASTSVFLPIAWRDTLAALRDPPSLLAWLSLIYSAVVAMVLANVLWQRAVRALGSTQSLVYFYLQPVIAILLAAAMLGERLGLLQAIGGAITLLGVGLVQRGKTSTG